MCEKWKDEVESMYVRNTSDKRMTVSIGKKCLLPNNKKQNKTKQETSVLVYCDFLLICCFLLLICVL